jgi:hypothetical protein
MLVGVQNVCASLVEQPGDAGHQALAVRAINQQNGGIIHASLSLSHEVGGLREKQKAPEQPRAPAMRLQRNKNDLDPEFLLVCAWPAP